MGNLSDWVANNTPHPLIRSQDELKPRWTLPKEPGKEGEQEAILQTLKHRFNGSPLKFTLTVNGHCMVEFPFSTTHEELLHWQKQINDFISDLQKKQQDVRSAAVPTGKYRFIPEGYEVHNLLGKGVRAVNEQSPRDTQFAGFANLLIDELIAMQSEDNREKAELIIARRAYDLAQHAIGHALEYLHECGIELSGSMNSRIQQSIPDITDWKQWGLPDTKREQQQLKEKAREQWEQRKYHA